VDVVLVQPAIRVWGLGFRAQERQWMWYWCNLRLGFGVQGSGIRVCERMAGARTFFARLRALLGARGQ
jgi:hypothetical protein